ncbi:MAG TPA: TonB-dependent receptor [Novosphingobium sp.]
MLGAAAALAPLPAQAAEAPDAPSEIVVTARKLDTARDAILPSLGASDYHIDRQILESQPGGVNRSLAQVLVQVPGVTLDSYGQVHVRNEHGNLQYRLNGVIVPESISGFGSTFDPHIADSIDLLTGTLPAQYGYRTSGVVNLRTRAGTFENGGDAGIYGGSRGTLAPSASVHGNSGQVNYFLSGSYLENDLGVENPTAARAALHDRTTQYRAFGYLSAILSDTSRITLFGGTSIGHFQIPNNPGQRALFTLNGQTTFDSAALDQNQREITHYGVLACQYANGPLNLQVAPFVRYSQTRYTPDPHGGDLILAGVADSSRLSSLAAGLQADASYEAGAAHKLRFGLFFQNERTRSLVISQVFAVDPTTLKTSDSPLSITDAGGRSGQLYGVYLQDEWSLGSGLTFNYGLRFDAVRAYTREQQLSPRANLVWKPATGTTLHLGYARNFTPPPQELVAARTLALFADTTKAPPTTTADPVRSEREHYFDAGIEQELAPGLQLGLDTYYKAKRNLLDEGQFGPSLVLSPFNYARGRAWGVELSASYHHGRLDLYANVARGQEQGRSIVSSQYFFAQDELNWIAQHAIFTDHSQFWTASGGASLVLHDGLGPLTPALDLLYGDGLRAADPAEVVPNGGKLPAWFTANIGIEQKFDGPGPLKGLAIRLDVTNLFDKVYLLRDGSGVGVGAPQYGARRGIFAGIRKAF